MSESTEVATQEAPKAAKKKPQNQVVRGIKPEEKLAVRFTHVPIPASKEELANFYDEAFANVSETTYVDEAVDRLDAFKVGNLVDGTVVRVGDDEIVLDIGFKTTTSMPRQEFSDLSDIQVGDKVKVTIDSIEDFSGQPAVSKRKADRVEAWRVIKEKMQVGSIVKGKAVRKIKGGLLVEIGVPAFLPASQIDIRRTGDVQDWLGREVEAMIIKIDIERRNIVLSRRRLLEMTRDKMKADLLASIEVGQIRRGVVKNITDFGAFIDLGGIDGLLHITDMSWGRVAHPSDVVKNDQTVEVQVLSFDKDRERISLGLKQLQPNPWNAIADKYPIASQHEGEVVSLMPYGAFVRLEEGIEGLVHVSEMSWTRQLQHPSEMVKVTDKVKVQVLDINKDKQEISLGMKQCETDPWSEVEEKYPVGTVIEGKVRNLMNYGAFVELEEGIDGLLHVSDMSWKKKINHPSVMLKKGDPVRAVVIAVDRERKRVSLGMKQLTEDPWKNEIPSRYVPGDTIKGKVTKLTSFGAFIEIEEDLEGLLHISEMSEEKIDKPEKVVTVGQELEVRIKNVDTKEHKIGLTLKTVTAGDQPRRAAEAGAPKSEDEIIRSNLGAALEEASKMPLGNTLEAALRRARSEKEAAEADKTND